LGFTVETLDCKTTTCRATVTWKDYSAAQLNGAKLVENTYPGLNCVQRINLLEPSDQTGPYNSKLYLDCTDLRAGLVDDIAAPSN
jgi:hypothetical protein